MTKKAIYAGGCFWGIEYYMQKQEGVVGTAVGYIGGTKENPTYEEVGAHATGHLEAIEIEYDPEMVSYETLTKLFFETHDPTQANGQGPDIGQQYLSAIFYETDEEREIAESLIEELKEKGYDVVTDLREATKFWPAEDYHQDYYNKKGSLPYCHGYTKRF